MEIYSRRAVLKAWTWDFSGYVPGAWGGTAGKDESERRMGYETGIYHG